MAPDFRKIGCTNPNLKKNVVEVFPLNMYFGRITGLNNRIKPLGSLNHNE